MVLSRKCQRADDTLMSCVSTTTAVVVPSAARDAVARDAVARDAVARDAVVHALLC